MPRTYAVVGSYYGGPRLKNMLQLLQDQPFDEFSILVNQQCGQQRHPRGFPLVYNQLINAAVSDPECEFVWIIGDDVTIMTPLTETQKIIENDPTIGAIFGVEAWWESDTLITMLPFIAEKVPIGKALLEGPEVIEQLFAGFACACIRADVWRAIGSLDLSLGRGYAEDLDWGIRCWAAGWRIVNDRRSWFKHERGGTYNQLINEGVVSKAEPYEAAAKAKEKWPWLWSAEPWEVTLERLHSMRNTALGNF